MDLNLTRAVTLDIWADGTVSFRRKGEPNTAYPRALPCFSVDTVEEAETLIVLTCRRQYDGRYTLTRWPDPDEFGATEAIAKAADFLAERYALMQRKTAKRAAKA